MKMNKKKLLNISLNIVMLVVLQVMSYYGKIYYEGYKDLKNNMYYNFEDFGEALETFNDELSKILVLGYDDFDKKKEFIDESIVRAFHRSNWDASDMGKGKAIYDYDFMYLNINKVIHNLLDDGNITLSEEKYIKSLYEYNEELIKEYNNILGDVRYNWNFGKIHALEKRIASIYNDYSQKADKLLETPKYKFLKEYEGEFKEVGFEHAKAYCEEVFSKLVKNQRLKYDNKDEANNDEYVFKNYKELDHNKELFTVKNDISDIDYKVTYNKKTKKVTVMAVSYIVPKKKYKEDELDNIVKNTIAKFNQNVVNYYKSKKYDSEGKLSYITYLYIEKNNDIYDEMKKIKINIKIHGLISKLEIIDHNDKPIILPNVSKKDILSKIDKEAEIIDAFIIRNMKGTAYVVHLKYGDTLYEAVFDGEDGKIIYYGRNIKKDYLNNLNKKNKND
ncbi:hypothetical protein FQB35_03595 [Crassaminicella thermophila]|uniref:Uncharacterized protein n=1 Tax=Crassaminicella thermophila TaxID=2599308 RepID=A0A5C0SBJ1_CRATE|nr:hypothetical protein [Crassaminicella thermophila]QEK11531.1 hypothetical protein FQB35_03595 [Crassaminicella thermophila]